MLVFTLHSCCFCFDLRLYCTFSNFAAEDFAEELEAMRLEGEDQDEQMEEDEEVDDKCQPSMKVNKSGKSKKNKNQQSNGAAKLEGKSVTTKHKLKVRICVTKKARLIQFWTLTHESQIQMIEMENKYTCTSLFFNNGKERNCPLFYPQ